MICPNCGKTADWDARFCSHCGKHLDENIIEFLDEDGGTVRFDVLDCFMYEGDRYLAVYPMEDDPDVLFMREMRDQGSYETVDEEDDDLYNLFAERNPGLFDFYD